MTKQKLCGQRAKTAQSSSGEVFLCPSQQRQNESQAEVRAEHMSVNLGETLFGEVTLRDREDLSEEDCDLRGHCEGNS